MFKEWTYVCFSRLSYFEISQAGFSITLTTGHRPLPLSALISPSLALLVYFDTSQIDYVVSKNVNVRGTGNRRELVINPTGLATGTGYFGLNVVDGAGASVSRAFTVHFGGATPEPVIPKLGIIRNGPDGLVLSWEGDALLYISRDLSGTFEPLFDAVSPYRVDTSGNAFFKLDLKP